MARLAQGPPSSTARQRGRLEPGHSDSTSQASKSLGCTACRPQCSPRASTRHTWVLQDSTSQEVRRRMRNSNKVTRVSDQVREALTSSGPPWAAASTRAEEWCPALPGQAHGRVPRPKVTSPHLPRLPAVPYRVSRISLVPRAQPCWGERSRRRLRPSRSARVPQGSRGVAREQPRPGQRVAGGAK